MVVAEGPDLLAKGGAEVIFADGHENVDRIGRKSKLQIINTASNKLHAIDEFSLSKTGIEEADIGKALRPGNLSAHATVAARAQNQQFLAFFCHSEPR